MHAQHARNAAPIRSPRPPVRTWIAILFLATSLGATCDGLTSENLGGLLDAATGAAGELDTDTIVEGLKEALKIGTDNTVKLTSQEGGFLDSDLIRIGLPESLEPMARGLRAVGFGGQVDDLEVGMNRAAEKAAGEAGSVFWDAITNMTFDDARSILDGGDTAATDFFRRVTWEPLKGRFDPIVADKMQDVGVVGLYDRLLGSYSALPLTQKPLVSLQDYVTEGALDGLFTVLADEEKKIRTDPSARVTDLLKRVFGS